MPLRIAIFGQAAFGRDVAKGLADAGHEIAAVYTPSEKRRADPLADLARELGWTLLQHDRFRRRGQAIAERVTEHAALEVELNVLPFTTAILPPEIVDGAAKGSLCFHPSLLPAFRGGAALAWQIILGAVESGVTVFQLDQGVDTGPILVQRRGFPIEAHDTAGSLYFQKLYEPGVQAMLEAVEAVASGTARPRPQSEEGASFQGLVDDAVATLDWSLPAEQLDRWIRGCDPSPGALAAFGGREVRLYDSRLQGGDSGDAPGRVLGNDGERLLVAAMGGRLSVGKLRLDAGPKLPAAEAGLESGDQLQAPG